MKKLIFFTCIFISNFLYCFELPESHIQSRLKLFQTKLKHIIGINKKENFRTMEQRLKYAIDNFPPNLFNIILDYTNSDTSFLPPGGKLGFYTNYLKRADEQIIIIDKLPLSVLKEQKMYSDYILFLTLNSDLTLKNSHFVPLMDKLPITDIILFEDNSILLSSLENVPPIGKKWRSFFYLSPDNKFVFNSIQLTIDEYIQTYAKITSNVSIKIENVKI